MATTKAAGTGTDGTGRMIERARYFEYTSAADPSTFMSPMPFAIFPASLHEAPDSRSAVIPLDLSSTMGLVSPATSPNLAAAFVRILPSEEVETHPVATSQLFYVIRGSGASTFSLAAGSEHSTINWEAGYLFSVPGATSISHAALSDAALYWVTDAPLLQYLGAVPSTVRFSPTVYTAAHLREQLQRVNSQNGSEVRNRNGVLLGTDATAATTKTFSHTLWALYNALPAGVTQPPHRHQSVAVDLCIAAAPGTYTLIAEEVDAAGNLVPPITRAEWVPGAVFTTPPGRWHSHHNETGVDAIILPVQDAGLHTHLRTLDICFAPRPAAAADAVPK